MVRELRFKGARDGRCNVCGAVGPLTEDHTPPKGCYRPTAMEVFHLHQIASGQPPPRRYTSNNGVRFRSLCATCNNERLGSQHDPALIAFSKDVSRVCQFRKTLPRDFNVCGKPQRIARSVFGHLAAAAVDGYGQLQGYEDRRDWFLSDNAALPTAFQIYHWLYPVREQVLVRGFGFTTDFGTGAGNLFFGWLLKFYPLAFLLATNDKGLRLSLPDLDAGGAIGLDDEVELPFRLRPGIHPHFPEAYAGENGMVLTGDHAMSARVRLPRGAR